MQLQAVGGPDLIPSSPRALNGIVASVLGTLAGSNKNPRPLNVRSQHESHHDRGHCRKRPVADDKMPRDRAEQIERVAPADHLYS
jgi:hypothetical protein